MLGCVIKWSLNLWNAEKIDSGHKFCFRWQQHWNDSQNEILVRGERILNSSQLFHELLSKNYFKLLAKNCPGPTHILFLTNPFNFICPHDSSLNQFLKHVSRSLMSSEKHYQAMFLIVVQNSLQFLKRLKLRQNTHWRFKPRNIAL